MANMLNCAKHLVFIVGLTLASSLFSQSDSSLGGYDRHGRPAWVGTPKPPLSESTSDSAPPVVRDARNRFFDDPSGRPLVPHDPKVMPLFGSGGADHWETRDPIPTDRSDVVVVATAQSFQPYISADNSTVYSELTAAPDEVLKDKRNVIRHGQSFIILQRGGTVQLSEGRIVESAPYGGSNPIRLMTRYLLFLRYHPEEQAFTVIRSWDLSRARPHEMDNDGHPYLNRPDSLENKLSSEEDLKALVRGH